MNNLNFDDVVNLLNDELLAADLDKLMRAKTTPEAKATGIPQLADVDVFIFDHKIMDDEQAFLVNSTDAVKGSEAVFEMQGFLASYDTIPEQHNSTNRMIYRAESMAHRVTLCGGGSKRFQSACKGLEDVAMYLEQFLPGTANNIDSYKKQTTIFASTPVVTKKDDQHTTHYTRTAVPKLYSLPNKITSFLSMGKFVFTEDNNVDFREVEVTEDKSGKTVTTSVEVSPLLFKLGQLVEATVSIRGQKNRAGSWFIQAHLQSLTLVGRKGSIKLFRHIKDAKNNEEPIENEDIQEMPKKRPLKTQTDLVQSSFKRLRLDEPMDKQPTASGSSQRKTTHPANADHRDGWPNSMVPKAGQ